MQMYKYSKTLFHFTKIFLLLYIDYGKRSKQVLSNHKLFIFLIVNH